MTPIIFWDFIELHTKHECMIKSDTSNEFVLNNYQSKREHRSRQKFNFQFTKYHIEQQMQEIIVWNEYKKKIIIIFFFFNEFERNIFLPAKSYKFFFAPTAHFPALSVNNMHCLHPSYYNSRQLCLYIYLSEFLRAYNIMFSDILLKLK